MGHFYHLAPWQSLHSVNKLQRGQISWLNIDDERRKTRYPTGAKSTHQRVIKQSHKKTYDNFFIYFWLIITILSRPFIKLDIEFSFWLFWSEPNLDCYWCHRTGSKRSHTEAYCNAFLRGSINGLSPFYGSNPAFVFHLCLHAFTIRNLKLNRPAQSHLIEHLTLSRSQKCSHNFPYRLIYMRSCECTWERDKVSAMMHWS